MPEGPSIVMLREAVQPYKGRKVIRADGNTRKLDLGELEGKKILDFKSWGKHFLICFKGFTIRVHFMLFGSYRINERRESQPRLSLQFSGEKELNFYACSVKRLTESLDELYDWSADVMNEEWDGDKALVKLQSKPELLVCDALLDQQLFAGVGNIIKNEVLFRIRVHPLSRIGAMPPEKLKELITEAVRYSFQFLVWKKEFTLKKHWLAHNQRECPRDQVRFQRQHLGKTHRRSFFCPLCQELYD